MAWTDLFTKFRYSNRQQPVGPAPDLDAPIVLPPEREYRIPTSGKRASSVQRDYYVLVYETQYPILTWDGIEGKLPAPDLADDPALDDLHADPGSPSLALRLSEPLSPQ